uniref:Uncharacterized protein n=1 Tax=Pararge aegeria TaxID=116150 RepID=S4NUV5_9NEOP
MRHASIGVSGNVSCQRTSCFVLVNLSCSNGAVRSVLLFFRVNHGESHRLLKMLVGLLVGPIFTQQPSDVLHGSNKSCNPTTFNCNFLDNMRISLFFVLYLYLLKYCTK